MNHIYEALPIIGQNLACTWAGFVRSRQRFTRHFHQTLQQWRKSVALPIEELHEIQRTRLVAMVEHARRTVPFYRDLEPPSSARDARIAIEETISRLPLLDKDTYRRHFEDILSTSIPPSRIHRSHTSGTTGTALPLAYTTEAVAEEYATVWRMRESCGIGLRDPHLTFGGQVIVPFAQSEPPFWRKNLFGRQTLFSVHHMTPRNLRDYVDEIHRASATYVMSYPSSLHLVARAMIEAGRTLPAGRIKAVFTSSESLLAFQRETIAQAFSVPIWDRYGTSEFAVSMTACEVGHLHVDMEYCIVEVEAEEETDEYVRGSLIVTGLSNNATPFLRYRIGDVGTRLKAPCPCGRAGDVFRDVDGRNEDYVVTPDGRLIGRLDHIFKKQLDILEAQILQDSKEAIEIVLVPSGRFDAAAEARLIREVRLRLGDEIHVDVRAVDAIPRERNGKFRAVKSRVGRLAA
jgi:phenylacetate-CoA ligase